MSPDVTYPSTIITNLSMLTYERLGLLDAITVTWICVKMFGTPEPDFSGQTKLSGSHHTMAFYRKGISFFMPSGNDDWDSIKKTGNPTHSKEIRDLIDACKTLNEDGVATPRAQPNRKRKSEGGGLAMSGRTSNGHTKRARQQTGKTSNNVLVSEEVGAVLRQLRDQKQKFMTKLEQMGASIERIKVCMSII